MAYRRKLYATVRDILRRATTEVRAIDVRSPLSGAQVDWQWNLDQARRQAPLIVYTLLGVEWVGPVYARRCFVCDGTPSTGHEQKCCISQALDAVLLYTQEERESVRRALAEAQKERGTHGGSYWWPADRARTGRPAK